MLHRLGFTGRLIAILLLLAFAGLLLATAAALLSRERQAASESPLPEQIAAIVSLYSRAGIADREQLLTAVNGSDLEVRAMDKAPMLPDHARPLPGAAWLIAQHLEHPERYRVEAHLVGSGDKRLLVRWFERNSPLSQARTVVVVGFAGDVYLQFATRGAPGIRVFGFAPGLGAGVFGALIAALAIWAVMRETRPIHDLERALSRFAKTAVPHTIKPSGAPDVRRLIASTNAMQERIANLIAARAGLLGGISHDLRTYLTRLRLRIEALGDGEARRKAEADLEEMGRLLDDALLIAQGRAVEARYQPVQLDGVIETEIEAREADQSRLSLVRLPAVQREGPWVAGDALALRRLIANLIENALRHAGKVQVSVIAGRSEHAVLVDDDGPGIPDALRERVFEPFYRTDPSRSAKTGGSGLGLAIVRQIAEAHGGSASADRSPMGGARMIVRLPATADAQQSPLSVGKSRVTLPSW